MTHNKISFRNGYSPKEYLEARVLVDHVTGCWNWQPKARFHFGHGQFTHPDLSETTIPASRASWMIYRGDPGDLHACHHCDNPPCCNPDHLFLGTAADNKHDAQRKKRHTFGVTQGRAKLNDLAVMEIRLLAGRKWLPKSEIAREYGVSPSLIDQVVSGKIWTHVPGV